MAESPSPINIKNIAVYLVIVLVLSLAGFWFHTVYSRAAQQNNLAPASRGQITVATQKAEIMTLRPNQTYGATLVAGEEGVVGADIPGKVTQILFNEGDTVQRGTPLIVQDSQDLNDQLNVVLAQLAAAQAALPKVEANVEISLRNYNDAKALYEAGAVSARDLSDAETGLKVAEADLAALRANIAEAESGIDRLRHSLDYTVIKAPIDGVVEDKSVVIGQYAAPGAPLAIVKNTSTVQAVFSIAQEDSPQVQTGQKVKISVSGNPQVYEGTVTYISTAASIASRTFTVKVDIPNPDRRLKPGSYAEAELLSAAETSVLAIPLRAVLGSSEDGYYVFTAENGAARRIGVTLGAAYDDLIEVRSGLTAGAEVICTNLNSLQDGDLISPLGLTSDAAEVQEE